MPVTIAAIEDIPALVALINSAYRGESSKKGWTTEADLLEGEMRTDTGMLNDIIKRSAAVLLKYTGAGGTITGSVFLEKQEKGLYLGMLTVSPIQQGGGIGKELMRAAEEYAREKDCTCIFMNVISIRHELVAWYERQGYKKTGETRPVSVEARFGIPTQPLEFAIMQKDI
jgi:ribosomal protein S18 acetylase RimI-like enzyme